MTKSPYLRRPFWLGGHGTGAFLSIEGISGAGKSTQAKRLYEHLRDGGQGDRVLLTHEPGATATGRILRQLLLEQAEPLVPEAEIALFFADRIQHLQEVIIPALKRGDTVVCDRFTDSTFAYQGGGRGMLSLRIDDVDQALLGGFRPNRTVVLDLPAKTGIVRTERPDRIESEAVDFHERIRKQFLEIARRNPKRVAVVSAEGTPDEVFERVLAAFGPSLP